uniref:1,2-diacyl-sn-glycerol:acetyl-CoA acetyltransferase n=1 Tax=Adonis aestivalis TaxID=113211 RepID=A0A221J480_9MAGN|nr:1,2-diacyl-sn-glycerol:acetyl-CoA acetyltransferase [Adonis aestivalis]
MGGELRNMINVWIIVSSCLTYCYFISLRIPKGWVRLLSFLPVISIFVVLPLLLSAVLPRLATGLAISWYANFKLLLIALSHDDPLSADPSNSLLDFILLTSLPIKINENPSKDTQNKKNELTFPLTFVMNAIIWSFMVQLDVKKKQYLLLANPPVNNLLYFIRIIYLVQIGLDLIAATAKPFLKHELQQPFNNPALSSSLQNLWGKRWNLMASSLLRSLVYIPIRSLFAPIVGRRWAIHLAVIATFTVSGLIHEVLYLYVGLGWPTWEVTCFFLINGVCVAIEIEVKKKASKSCWRLPRVISVPSTVAFIVITGSWLCCKELMRCGADIREMEEYVALVDYMKRAIFATS